jgi:hypothetical protein
LGDSVDEGLEFATKFDIYLAEANLCNDTDTEFGMVDAITECELMLHGVGAKRPDGIRIGGGLFFRGAGRCAGRSGFGLAVAINMVTLAGTALNAFNAPL